MKDLKKYKVTPKIELFENEFFTNPKIVGYVLEEKKRRPVVEATCTCGKNTLIRLNNYKAKKIKSCGCRLSRKSKLNVFSYPEYVAYTDEVSKKYNDYLKRSKSNNIAFNLTVEQFSNVYSQSCSYCGIDIHGIDRINSAKGYELGNVKSCCKYCNRAKHQESEESFLV